MSNWNLGSLGNGMSVEVALDEVMLLGASSLVTDAYSDPGGDEVEGVSQIKVLIEQMIEMDLAAVDGADVSISFEDFAEMSEDGFGLLRSFVHKTPFQVKVSALGTLGMDSFAIKLKWVFNDVSEQVETRGCFVKCDYGVFALSAPEYQALRLVEQINDLKPFEKLGQRVYELLGEFKRQTGQTDWELDSFLKKREVIAPDIVGIGVVKEEDGRQSLVPEVEGVDNESFKKQFKLHGFVPQVYEVATTDGKRCSLVLGKDHQEALERLSTVSHLKKEAAHEALGDPARFFDGLGGVVDLSKLSGRIYGVGSFPFVATPFVKRGETGIFDDLEGVAGESGAKINAGIRLTFADGHQEDVSFESRDELQGLIKAVRRALEDKKKTIEFRQHTLGVDEELLEKVSALEKVCSVKRKSSDDLHAPPEKYLLIFTNENAVEFKDPLVGNAAELELQTTFEQPASLLRTAKLKIHQKIGTAWLQHNFNLKRQGCLLADDMGLGKTLQVLTFLAWLIEKGEGFVDNGIDEDGFPTYNPVLIIAPLILIENETWIKDMKAFFEGDGSVFSPWLTLRPDTIKKFRQKAGQETVIGAPALNLKALCRHRVILTNYETVVNYQHSFASMHRRWSAVVTDEAQAYKVSSTKTSHALKSLSPRFRIAATGTPVETRLSDIWNIFDYLQPGELLGSASDFRKGFERSINETEELNKSINALKERLHFGRKNAFILRRDKGELTDLPRRFEHRLECQLSAEQVEYHNDLLRRASFRGDGNHAFTLVNEFLRLYQHFALVPSYNPVPPMELIKQSTKLQSMLSKISEIRARDEKVLIFARSLDMQQILVAVLKHQFGILTQIVNGSTKKGMRGESDAGPMTRKAIIERFRKSSGFNVLILSPEVAGTGLTLTEANHVFHYGRWWNPAKESQATDRVYRIGQERDVHVYYLIAKAPANQFETFDEKLDRLLTRRLSMASDFLAPKPSEDDLQKEFLGELFS